MTTKYITAYSNLGDREVGIVRVEGYHGTDKTFTCERARQVFGSGPYVHRGKKRNMIGNRRDSLHIFDTFEEARTWAVAALERGASNARVRARRILAEADETARAAERLSVATEEQCAAEVSAFLRSLLTDE